MSSEDRSIAPTLARKARRHPRWTIGLLAASLVIGAAIAVTWYFTLCGSCGRSPILCTDPCTLPTFGQILNPDAITASAPFPPPHQA